MNNQQQYIIKLEAFYLKKKQQLNRERTIFKSVLQSLGQMFDLKNVDQYLEKLPIFEEEDALVDWQTLVNKNDNVIRINKNILKKDTQTAKPKRKRRTKQEMFLQQD